LRTNGASFAYQAGLALRTNDIAEHGFRAIAEDAMQNAIGDPSLHDPPAIDTVAPGIAARTGRTLRAGNSLRAFGALRTGWPCGACRSGWANIAIVAAWSLRA
jgi:hypothetical protein